MLKRTRKGLVVHTLTFLPVTANGDPPQGITAFSHVIEQRLAITSAVEEEQQRRLAPILV